MEPIKQNKTKPLQTKEEESEFNQKFRKFSKGREKLIVFSMLFLGLLMVGLSFYQSNNKPVEKTNNEYLNDLYQMNGGLYNGVIERTQEYKELKDVYKQFEEELTKETIDTVKLLKLEKLLREYEKN